MSLEELISIERVEFEISRERVQETYVIADLLLSKLFKEVLNEVEMGVLPMLSVKILLYALRSVPFTNEVEGVRIVENLSKYMDLHSDKKPNQYNYKAIVLKLQAIRDLILYNYIIEGSLIVYHINQIRWDLNVSFSFQNN